MPSNEDVLTVFKFKLFLFLITYSGRASTLQDLAHKLAQVTSQQDLHQKLSQLTNQELSFGSTPPSHPATPHSAAPFDSYIATLQQKLSNISMVIVY